MNHLMKTVLHYLVIIHLIINHYFIHYIMNFIDQPQQVRLYIVLIVENPNQINIV